MARFPPADMWVLPHRFWQASRVNRLAILFAVLWAVLVLSYGGGYFAGLDGAQPRGTTFLDAVFFLVALVLPLGLTALAAWLAAELARQREVVAALVAAAGPLTEALAETQGALFHEGPLTPQELERALAGIREEIGGQASALAEWQRRIEALLASPPARPAAVRPADASRGPEVPVPPETETAGQPELPSMDAPPQEDLGWSDLLRALDFPKDAEDREGFRALRRALRHHNLAQMLQAAEDVLNLLSQEGVYMDDLHHEPAPPEAWRAFAEGRRGPETEAIGGIRDAGALEVVQRLMRSDGVFRDTALFFQRRFDRVLGEVAPSVDDAGLVALANTRSGRAFMLCARASGSFG